MAVHLARALVTDPVHDADAGFVGRAAMNWIRVVQEDEPVQGELARPPDARTRLGSRDHRVEALAADRVLPRPVRTQILNREFSVDRVPRPSLLNTLTLEQAKAVATPRCDVR